ncbi:MULTISPECIES: hypothetical protein [unclassified Streptococcus]|nr:MULTISPECIES: hypothetical protein [unclassified Streptococcus]MBF0786443.1 hypothetical protein [Streptococcus sp. 19428wC2_LYSM12]MCQ9212551.1 hypothetical protein [Streptococcus sp. B01]MCQ9213890.1 hypothetical protein [Streptococcus sp. O1]
MWNKVFRQKIKQQEAEKDTAVLLEKAQYFAALYQDTANTYQFLRG